MTRRAIYTIRDCEGWVRYVGSSGLPEGRYAAHLNSDTPIGVFMRLEREAGRETYLRTEEWLPTKQLGFEVEKLYIAGYAKLSGDRLLNRARPGCRVKIASLIGKPKMCIQPGCEMLRVERGLCKQHFNRFQYLKRQYQNFEQMDEYDRRCVEAGIVFAKPP